MKITKIFNILLIIMLTGAILGINNKIYASNYENIRIADIKDPVDNPSAYRPDKRDENADTKLENKVEDILGYISIIGVVVSVITIMIVGIKYMIGSIEEKAEYKKTMIPYLVGAILVFAAVPIANMVYNFANGIKN